MNGSGDETDETLTQLRFVGDKTASVLAASDIHLCDIERKRISYTELVEAGVNPGVAARIRRAHSLSWSFESSGDDLERRSAQVRGLGEEERAWVAASSGDWESTGTPSSLPGTTTSSDDTAPASADSTGDAVAAEAAWRERSRPTPVTVLTDIDEETVTQFRDGGILSVRRLATVDPSHVADALDLDEETVCRWRDAARDYQG